MEPRLTCSMSVCDCRAPSGCVEEDRPSMTSSADALHLVVAAFTAGTLREDRPSSMASICPRVSWRSSSAFAWRGGGGGDKSGEEWRGEFNFNLIDTNSLISQYSIQT